MLRLVFALGTATACVLAYSLSEFSRFEAIVLPAISVGLMLFGIALYGRVRSRQEWSAAWEAYARSDDSHEKFRGPVNQEIRSWAGTN